MKKKKKRLLTASEVSKNPILKDMIEKLFNPDNKIEKWSKPWSSKDFKLQGHQNPCTKNIYQGSNAFLLAFQQLRNNYNSFLWITYLNGINLFGEKIWGEIVKNEKSSNVFKPYEICIEKKEKGKILLDENENPVFSRFFKYKYGFSIGGY